VAFAKRTRFSMQRYDHNARRRRDKKMRKEMNECIAVWVLNTRGEFGGIWRHIPG